VKRSAAAYFAQQAHAEIVQQHRVLGADLQRLGQHGDRLVHASLAHLQLGQTVVGRRETRVLLDAPPQNEFALRVFALGSEDIGHRVEGLGRGRLVRADLGLPRALVQLWTLGIVRLLRLFAAAQQDETCDAREDPRCGRPEFPI
jgi:hypothetical protein